VIDGKRLKERGSGGKGVVGIEGENSGVQGGIEGRD